MRSRLAARSTRLVLAAAAITALAATTTACDPEDAADAAGPAAPSAAASASSGGSDGSSSDKPSASGSGSNGSSTGGSTDKTDSGDGKKDGYGQSCGTNDLSFTVTSESQAGGYYLVTAKAKPGITCFLEVNTPSVSFGSGADGVASPVGQGGEDPIKLTGSAVAYTSINPKTTDGDGGTEFENVIISTTEDDPNPAELKLPDPATVEKPMVTNWAANRAEAVPVIV
ncbi:hypothetical protein OHU11_00710 [Streptomyces sp. NBC_00257]|uniref:DUF4232 domain-containing protein n=1 Tax=unclassified Streptomyces TaxID=2593676 RepID=UPI00225B2213|nr:MULTISPECIES: DUF4232 domain-containing protein [unclassified Streptomyces]WTB59430.1 hypothetical protein OG832_43240 [Streptomyces sp. NBC_00826]WTH87700.1 hypothetical protein OIC43_00480 [Streptomyces sp. NBC_00825]WTH96426.1 hypothetical protein OHA23_00490 [Streptomyces sp. NBC_00822]MCX4869887.1 hypothetical protein [Streptomyces sp. NBC_00906]MCX4901050.1 hypothetical protein [Streptomyces sp. NBC_00892]